MFESMLKTSIGEGLWRVQASIHVPGLSLSFLSCVCFVLFVLFCFVLFVLFVLLVMFVSLFVCLFVCLFDLVWFGLVCSALFRYVYFWFVLFVLFVCLFCLFVCLFVLFVCLFVCFVLFCFVLFCFVLFCFVLFVCLFVCLFCVVIWLVFGCRCCFFYVQAHLVPRSLNSFRFANAAVQLAEMRMIQKLFLCSLNLTRVICTWTASVLETSRSQKDKKKGGKSPPRLGRYMFHQ